LLELHYDPLYRRSQNHNFIGKSNPQPFATNDLSPAGIACLARDLVQSRMAQMA